MPIDVADLQRRSVPLGEIRIGYSVPIPGKSGRQPMRSDTFIFTTDESAAEVVAAKFGGTVTPWDRRKGRFAVTTDRSRLNVWVPPRGLAVDANMELWDGGKRLRQCTGTRMLSPQAGPCLCPQPENPLDPDSVQRAREERKRLAGLRTPQACKPRTLINVSITELPGLTGVWRLASGSESVAVESADQGDALAIARDAGAYLPAVLLIDQRFRISTGTPYPVLKLRISMSAEDLARGALPAGPAGLLRQIQSGTPERVAITSGAPPREERPALAPVDRPLTAQQIADLAAKAATRGEIERLNALAEENRVEDDLVNVGAGTGEDEVWEGLHPHLQTLWKKLPGAGAAA